MAKNKHKTNNKPNKKISKKSTTQEILPEHWIFPKLDTIISKRLELIFYVSVVIAVLIGAKLFDLKVSEGGDDSGYIVAAMDFIKGKNFPTWHGSFYPIFISPFVAVFGINLFVFKFLSFICIILHLVFFHYTFRKFISPTFLAIIYLILAVNSHLLYYASQTYSEALYIMLQMIGVMLVLIIIEKHNKNDFKYQLSNWKIWLLTGFVVLLVAQTRNVGLALLLSIIFVFAVNKKFVLVLFGIGAYAAFALPLRIYKALAWDVNEGSASQQFQTMFLKNPYNPTAGTEDFSGMVTRFFENLEIYMSKHLPIILGLRPEDSNEKSMFIAVSISLVLLAVFVISYKKSIKIFFVATTTVGGIVATFITQQVFWGQSRLILIFMPFILILFTWLVMHLSTIYKFKIVKTIMLVFFGLIFIKTLGVSLEKIDDHKRDLKKNMKGDPYAGFTPDWEHFLRMSEWASENLPDDMRIGSRKPSMSFIYGNGKDFFGLYKFLMYDVEELLNAVKEKHGDIIALDLKKLQKTATSKEFQYYLGRTSVGFIYNNAESYILVDKNAPTTNLIEDEIKSHHFEYESSYDEFYSRIKDNIRQFNSTSSDSLLHHLYKNDVDYLIRGSLRVNPRMKTDRTINTVARFMYYIQLKYPGIFQTVQQIGEKENEPAYLFKINYDAYKINDNSFK